MILDSIQLANLTVDPERLLKLAPGQIMKYWTGHLSSDCVSYHRSVSSDARLVRRLAQEAYNGGFVVLVQFKNKADGYYSYLAIACDNPRAPVKENQRLHVTGKSRQ